MSNLSSEKSSGLRENVIDENAAVNPFENYREKELDLMVKLRNDLSSRITGRDDQRIFQDYSKKIESFSEYIGNNKIQFTDDEEAEFNGITKGNYTISIKRRLFEDFYHKIKNRISIENVQRRRKQAAAKEIAEYKNQTSILANWINLTLFSSKFNTITFFIHRFRDKSFKNIREKAFNWQQTIQSQIAGIVNTEPERFSIPEYNFLKILLDLEEPLSILREIPTDDSYDAARMDEPIKGFCDLYFKLIANAELGQRALESAFSKNEMPKGLPTLLENLCQKGRNRLTTKHEYMTNSIMGSLYSFFTSKEGKLVSTFSQLLYVTSVNVELETRSKDLTEDARIYEQKQQEQVESEEHFIMKKYGELQRITEEFPRRGENLIQIFFKNEEITLPTESTFKFNRAYFLRPMLLYFYKYFGAILLDKDDSLSFHYKDKTWDNFFKRNEELQSVLRELAQIEQLIANVEWEAKGHKRDIKNEVIDIIMKLTYTIARIISDYIRDYERAAETDAEGQNSNEYYKSTTIEGRSADKLASLLQREKIFLHQFLNDSCAICYYIAELLHHPSFALLAKEKSKLRAIYHKISLKIDMNNNPDNYSEGDLKTVKEENEKLKQQIESLQLDELTGLPNRHYLNNKIIPSSYDENKLYNDDISRYVFFCDIDKFKNFNDEYGHHIGDLVLKQVGEFLSSVICISNPNKNNTVMRLGGEEFMGYINDASFDEVLKMLSRANHKIYHFNLKSEDMDIRSISCSFGVYREHPGTNQSFNMKVADNIMYFVKEHGRNNIAFLRDKNKILSEDNFDKQGHIAPNLIELYH